MTNKSFTIIFLFFAAFLISCNCNSPKDKKLPVPEIKKQVQIKINRYEKDLFSIDKTKIKEELKRLKPKYSFFLDADLDDDENVKQLSDYINDKMIIENYEEVQKKFPDISFLEKDISMMLTHYHYFFPDKKIPEVYTYVSGSDFENTVIFADSVLLIALDMYLGKDYKLYLSYGLPLFIRNYMTAGYIVKDCAEAIAKYHNYDDLKNVTCLESMIYFGKNQLIVDALIPDVSDTVKFEYTKSQMDWCYENESKIWAFFIDNQLLYNKDFNNFGKYFSHGPFTTNFSKKSAPRIGVWLGWRILREYVNKTGTLNLKKIIENKNAQEILSVSKYKPGKS